MQVTIHIPDNLAVHFTEAGKSPATVVLEALALEGYRSGQFSEGEIRGLLGYETPMEVHTLLATHGIDLRYTVEHLQLDIAASDKLHEQRSRKMAHAA